MIHAIDPSLDPVWERQAPGNITITGNHGHLEKSILRLDKLKFLARNASI